MTEQFIPWTIQSPETWKRLGVAGEFLTALTHTDGSHVYIHKPCLETLPWGADVEARYGPIDKQGCDRCECAPDGQWALVLVKS